MSSHRNCSGPTDDDKDQAGLPDVFFDLPISQARIRHYATLDLGQLTDLPVSPEDLVALSIAMDRRFAYLVHTVLTLLAEEHEHIAQSAFDHIRRELVLDFVERYGTLAFLSASLLRTLWAGQRLKPTRKNAQFLRDVGKRLVIFYEAQTDNLPQKHIGIAYTISKRHFLTELQQLGRCLASSLSDEPKVDQLLRFVEDGEYAMLKGNLELLKQFLRSQRPNFYLRAKNEICAERLACWGSGGIADGISMAPDLFYRVWIGWMTNKSPKTVDRLIHTAEKNLRTLVTSANRT